MSGGISRTVQPGAPLGVAPRGRLAAEMPLTFPNKNAGETLDYAVDFSQEVSGSSYSSISSSAVLESTGSISLSGTRVDGLVVGFDAGGGASGSGYIITVSATLTSSMTSMSALIAVAEIELFVNAPAEIATSTFTSGCPPCG